MTGARTFLAICALVLPISLVATGCGGDDAGDRDPREVVERAFDHNADINSGVIDLALGAVATGEESGSFEASLGGAFETESGDENELPLVDLSGEISGEADGDEIDESARLILTDANAYVEYDGETYEAGEEMFAELSDQFKQQAADAGVDSEQSVRQACEEAMSQAGGDPAACDIDVAQDWLTNLENEGTEDVEGAETVHVSGDINVERMLGDVAQLGDTIPGFNAEGFNPSQFAPAVPEATFDLYSGVDDDVLRRFDLRLVIEPAAVTGGFAVVPVERVEIDFSFTLSELNEAQTIEAPSGPTTPLADLFDGFGPGALGGGLGGLPDLDGGAPGDQPDDSEPAPSEPGEGPSQEDFGDVDPEQAEEYLECIQDAAQRGDQSAFEECAEQLQP